MRVGIGYDVHAFTPGRRLVLGGVDIPFDVGLDGWSDADVLTHAVMDALLIEGSGERSMLRLWIVSSLPSGPHQDREVCGCQSPWDGRAVFEVPSAK